MTEKMKKDITKFTFMFSLIAIGLLIPEFFNIFTYKITDITIINLISIIFIIVVNIILACISYQKKLSSLSLMLPVIIYVISKLVYYIYWIIQNQFSSIAYLVLYIAIFVLYFIQINQKKGLNILYILLALAICFDLLSVFSASAIGLSNLITLGLFTNILYWNNKHREIMR